VSWAKTREFYVLVVIPINNNLAKAIPKAPAPEDDFSERAENNAELKSTRDWRERVRRKKLLTSELGKHSSKAYKNFTAKKSSINEEEEKAKRRKTCAQQA
jgi:hypothetical protein